MKKYFKSLLPLRWIVLFAFTFLSWFTALFGFAIYKTSTPLSIIILIAIPIFWMLFDYVFGVGQLSIWERISEERDMARRIKISAKFQQVITYDQEFYVTEDEFKVLSNAETVASKKVNKEVFDILKSYINKNNILEPNTNSELTDITIDVATPKV